MREQGKSAVILGSDGLDSGDFIGVANGSYFSAFAPDIRRSRNAAVRAIIASYTRAVRANAFQSNFGPPMYVATQAAYVALRAACADGQATRAEVLRAAEDGSTSRTSCSAATCGSTTTTTRGPREFYLFRVVNGKAQFIQ